MGIIYLPNVLVLLFRIKVKVDYLLNFLTNFWLEIGKRATFIWFVLVLITLLKSYFGNRKKWGLLQSHLYAYCILLKKNFSLLIEKKSLKTRCEFLMKYLLEIGFKSLIC